MWHEANINPRAAHPAIEQVQPSKNPKPPFWRNITMLMALAASGCAPIAESPAPTQTVDNSSYQSYPIESFEFASDEAPIKIDSDEKRNLWVTMAILSGSRFNQEQLKVIIRENALVLYPVVRLDGRVYYSNRPLIAEYFRTNTIKGYPGGILLWSDAPGPHGNSTFLRVFNNLTDAENEFDIVARSLDLQDVDPSDFITKRTFAFNDASLYGVQMDEMDGTLRQLVTSATLTGDTDLLIEARFQALKSFAMWDKITRDAGSVHDDMHTGNIGFIQRDNRIITVLFDTVPPSGRSPMSRQEALHAWAEIFLELGIDLEASEHLTFLNNALDARMPANLVMTDFANVKASLAEVRLHQSGLKASTAVEDFIRRVPLSDAIAQPRTENALAAFQDSLKGNRIYALKALDALGTIGDGLALGYLYQVAADKAAIVATANSLRDGNAVPYVLAGTDANTNQLRLLFDQGVEAIKAAIAAKTGQLPLPDMAPGVLSTYINQSTIDIHDLLKEEFQLFDRDYKTTRELLKLSIGNLQLSAYVPILLDRQLGFLESWQTNTIETPLCYTFALVRDEQTGSAVPMIVWMLRETDGPDRYGPPSKILFVDTQNPDGSWSRIIHPDNWPTVKDKIDFEVTNPSTQIDTFRIIFNSDANAQTPTPGGLYQIAAGSTGITINLQNAQP